MVFAEVALAVVDEFDFLYFCYSWWRAGSAVCLIF